MEVESQQFLQERAERIRLIHDRQERELEQFDEESARLGFRYGDILAFREWATNKIYSVGCQWAFTKNGLGSAKPQVC